LSRLAADVALVNGGFDPRVGERRGAASWACSWRGWARPTRLRARVEEAADARRSTGVRGLRPLARAQMQGSGGAARAQARRGGARAAEVGRIRATPAWIWVGEALDGAWGGRGTCGRRMSSEASMAGTCGSRGERENRREREKEVRGGDRREAGRKKERDGSHGGRRGSSWWCSGLPVYALDASGGCERRGEAGGARVRWWSRASGQGRPTRRSKPPLTSATSAVSRDKPPRVFF
jgi:hypothetical protein